MKAVTLQQLERSSSSYMKNILPDVPMISVGMGTCGIGNGADVLYDTLFKYINENNISAKLKPVGCLGFCAEEPLVTLYQPGKPLLVYSKVLEKDVIKILDGALSGKIYTKGILCRIESWDHITRKIEYGKGYEKYPLWNEIPFSKGRRSWFYEMQD